MKKPMILYAALVGLLNSATIKGEFLIVAHFTMFTVLFWLWVQCNKPKTPPQPDATTGQTQ